MIKLFKHKATYCLAASISLLSTNTFAENNSIMQPRLILQITVDALRGDMPQRFFNKEQNGGFNYLLNNGIFYNNAHYPHANTETIVGHASLATGAPPSVHGMVGNVWYNRQLGRVVYNIEDKDHHLLGSGKVDKKSEIDATQKAAKSSGRSPISILSSTFSDELASASNGQSKVFAVSVKDRGAVPLAGQLGKAFWFSKSAKRFVSSDYYYSSYPSWVDEWNNSDIVKRYEHQAWSLSQASEGYLFTDTLFKNDPNKQFPHPYGDAQGKYYGTLLTLSPAGDEITLDFAQKLIEKEQLGQDSVPDYLSISFSSNDYVIHMFGPSSLEAEDNLLRLNQTLAKLFKFIDQKVGLQNTLIVLSADHGAAEIPPYLNLLGNQKAKYFDQLLLEDEAIYSALKKKFGVGRELIRLYSKPYIYLNHQVINKHKLDLNEVQHTVAKLLEDISGVEYAVTMQDVQTNQLEDKKLLRAVANNFHHKRSGDIHIVFSPHTYINQLDGLTVSSTHGSPWSYDTHVPIFFAGMGITQKRVSRPVSPYDISPTLSSYLGILSPTGSTGIPLKEIVK